MGYFLKLFVPFKLSPKMVWEQIPKDNPVQTQTPRLMGPIPTANEQQQGCKEPNLSISYEYHMMPYHHFLSWGYWYDDPNACGASCGHPLCMDPNMRHHSGAQACCLSFLNLCSIGVYIHSKELVQAGSTFAWKQLPIGDTSSYICMMSWKLWRRIQRSNRSSTAWNSKLSMTDLHFLNCLAFSGKAALEYQTSSHKDCENKPNQSGPKAVRTCKVGDGLAAHKDGIER